MKDGGKGPSVQSHVEVLNCGGEEELAVLVGGKFPDIN